MSKTINILGCKWTIKERTVKQDVELKDCDGYYDWTTKTIVIDKNIDGTLSNIEEYKKKVKRHEIIHAFLCESGLLGNSINVKAWAENEEMVDWIAQQGIKLYNAWLQANAI